jgi:hypothetical protein
MATAVQVQYRRGSASQVAAFTGAQGELVVDTTNSRVVVQDGATPGGFAAAKLSETVTNTRTAVSDTNYSAQTTDRSIAYTAITAARTVTLPAAASYPTGTQLLVVDETGSCSATKTITLNRAGSDTINGAAAAVMSSAYAYIAIESNGANAWTIVDQSTLSMGQQAAGAVAITGGTINSTTIGGTTPAAATVTAPSAGDSSARAITSAWFGQNLPGGDLNKFRNGTMDVWQRGTSSLTATTAGGYTADGWIVLPTGASVTAAQAGGRLFTKNSLQVTGAASVTDVVVKQRIESLIAAAFCSQTITIQAQVYNNTGGSITPKLTVNRPSAQDNYASVTADVNAVNLQACANGAWTLVAYSFAANAASYNGLEIAFDFGNNFSSAAKTVQIAECDIRVTPGVATGLNSNPPPPELRPLAFELPFCQRYFDKSYAMGTAPGANVGAGGGSVWVGQSAFESMRFSQRMRAVPTFTGYDNTGASGKLSYYSGGWQNGQAIGSVNSGVSDALWYVQGYSGGTTNFDYTASAEL